MAKNMDQLRNQNEKGTKAMVLRAKDLKHARQGNAYASMPSSS